MSENIKIKIRSLNDVKLLSEIYKKGEIKLNISKIARELGCDRKTVRKRLEGYTPKTKKNRKKYLDDYKNIIISYLKDNHRHFCKCQSKYVKKIQNKNVHFIHLPSGKNLLVYKNFQLF